MSVENFFVGCQYALRFCCCYGLHGSEASIAISFITTRSKTYSIARMSHCLDVSCYPSNQVVQLAVFRRGLICSCSYALAKLHNSLQLVECASTNHSNVLHVFSTNQEQNKKPIAVARREFVGFVLKLSVRTAASEKGVLRIC